MRAVVQRVSNANVIVNGEIVGGIQKGFMVLLGVEDQDDVADVDYMVEKIIHLRVFEDYEGKMNLSLMDIKGELLVVSQFTLLGDCRKGRRPSFINAARPEKANQLYGLFIDKAKAYNLKVETGVFQAEMKVNICNDGPVTLMIDSRKNF